MFYWFEFNYIHWHYKLKKLWKKKLCSKNQLENIKRFHDNSKLCCCCCSVTKSYLTLGNPIDCSTPGPSVLHYLPEIAQVSVHWVSDAMQTSHPLLSTSSPAFNLFQHQGLFKSVSSFIRWPKYWSIIFNISPSNEYSGLISFRIDWLDLLCQQI